MEKLPKDAVVFSYYVGDLDTGDMQVIYRLKQILDKKLEISDRVIDLVKLKDYFGRTELKVRQMINYLENNVYYGKEFVLANGTKEYERIDAIRATQVQERTIG